MLICSNAYQRGQEADLQSKPPAVMKLTFSNRVSHFSPSRITAWTLGRVGMAMREAGSSRNGATSAWGAQHRCFWHQAEALREELR